MLYYEIMNQWNDTTQAPGEAEAPQVPVGRETLYAALRAAAGSFAEGAVRRCSQLFIGEVGSGKSELISHFLRWSDLSALLVLRCGCLQSEEGLPLWPPGTASCCPCGSSSRRSSSPPGPGPGPIRPGVPSLPL